MLARFFIDRPVLAWVISIVIILLGAIARVNESRDLEVMGAGEQVASVDTEAKPFKVRPHNADPSERIPEVTGRKALGNESCELVDNALLRP